MQPEYHLSREFQLKDVPEFQRLQAGNPTQVIDELQSAIMYGRAIHWISFLDIIWPDFEKVDYFSVEVAYIVYNDPDRENIPPEFYKKIANDLAMFWKIQLTNLYPAGNWNVDIRDDPEITVEAYIKSRQGEQTVLGLFA